MEDWPGIRGRESRLTYRIADSNNGHSPREDRSGWAAAGGLLLHGTDWTSASVGGTAMTNRLGPYRALDFTFSIDVFSADDCDLGRLFEPLAAPTTDVGHVYDFTAPDGDELGAIRLGPERKSTGSRPDGLLQMLITDVGRRALEDVVASFHAVALQHDGRTVLLAGPSRAGKSTLAAALLAKGWALLAEDICALADDGTIRPYPRPLGLSAESRDLLGIRVPDDDCRCGKKLMLATDVGTPTAAASPARPDAIVIVDRTQDGLATLTPVAALGRLAEWRCASGFTDRQGFEQIARTVAAATTVRVDTVDLAVAVDWVEQLRPRRSQLDVCEFEHFEHASVAWLGTEAFIHDQASEQVHACNPTSTLVLSELQAGATIDDVATEFGLVVDDLADIARLAAQLGLAP
jgi:hypothetical protein